MSRERTLELIRIKAMRAAGVMLVALSCRADSADPVDIVRRSISANTANLEKESMSFRMVWWIDEHDFHPVRYELEVIGDGSKLKKTPKAWLTLAKVNDDVWMPKEIRINYHLTVPGVLNVRGERITAFSDFKKLEVESTIKTRGDSR